MIIALLTALAQSGPVVVHPAPQSEVVPWVDRRRQARDPQLLRQTMISAHNRARRGYGVAPLAWDEGLAQDAAAYANVLARSGRFQHDPQYGRRVRQGENLWMGTRGAYSLEEMAGSWAEERRLFRAGTFPDVRTSGRWEDGAPYTQMIWRATARLGCALHASGASDFLVCRYAPAGNVVGQAVP